MIVTDEYEEAYSKNYFQDCISLDRYPPENPYHVVAVASRSNPRLVYSYCSVRGELCRLSIYTWRIEDENIIIEECGS
jgi:hypothetical protein